MTRRDPNGTQVSGWDFKLVPVAVCQISKSSQAERAALARQWKLGLEAAGFSSHPIIVQTCHAASGFAAAAARAGFADRPCPWKPDIHRSLSRSCDLQN